MRTLEKAEQMVAYAALTGATLIAFPEQFTTGWDPESVAYCESTEGPVVTSLIRFAEEYGIAILGSFRERTETLPRNTAVTIDSNGRILTTYAKIHPFSPAHEDAHYLAGNDVGIFSLAGVSFGIAICYDLRFPALFRIYALKGVHCVLVPAAWPAPRRHHWELLIRSRALDNRIYIAGINTTGTNPVDSYHGGSMAADPDGNVIMQAGEKEGTYVFSIDPENVLSQQASQVASDRRSTLYHQLLS